MSHYRHMDHFSLYPSLPQAVLSALKLDGEVTSEYQFWDVVQDWRSRSTHVLNQFTAPLVLTGVSAVWALGLCSEPQTHTASTVSTHRVHIPFNTHLRIEERTLKSYDYWLYRQTGVTTPLRTITDILRMRELSDSEASLLTQEIQAKYSLSQDTLMEHLQLLNSVPNKRLALNRAVNL